jgi:uncharacterized glyoxalase superfamily protein PhnB
MTERPLDDRLNDLVDLIVARGDATAALRDPVLAPLARIAADLRQYPRPAFKSRLRTHLERSVTMTATAAVRALREGFTTVTPYLRASGPGLVEFLARVFDATETFSTRGGGGGMHREVRIGDSMLMIGEGGGGEGGVMPIRPMAFHVSVPDVDATFRRAMAAGATSMGDPADQAYGERSGFVKDAFGNQWYIGTPLGPQSVLHSLRTVTPFLHARGASGYAGFLVAALDGVAELRHEEPAGHLRYVRIRIGDAAIELSENDPMPGSFMLYVPDPEASYRRAIEAGATSLAEPFDQPYGRTAWVQDPAGSQWFFTRPSGM